MAFCVLPFLSIFLWVSLSFAQNGVTFLYPTKGLEFYYLDTVNVTWTSNFTTPFLFTFCSNPNKTVLTSTYSPFVLFLEYILADIHPPSGHQVKRSHQWLCTGCSELQRRDTMLV